MRPSSAKINKVVQEETWNEGEVLPCSKSWIGNGKGRPCASSPWDLTPQPQCKAKEKRKRKSLEWERKEKLISQHNTWVRKCQIPYTDLQARQPCPTAIEGLEEIQLPPFLSERLTRALGSLAHQAQVDAGWGEYQAGGIRGYVWLHEDAELYCQCCMIPVCLPGLCCSRSWSALAEEPQHRPTLSSIVAISLPLPVLPEMHLYLDKMGDFPCRHSRLVQVWGRTAFFHVPALSLSLRGTLMHPQQKASSFGVVWVSKFPSFFSIAATRMFTLWRPSWSFTFESCQSLSSPLPSMKTFFLADSCSQKMRERSVTLLICLLLPWRLFPRLNVVQLSSHHFSVPIYINEVPGKIPLNFPETTNWVLISQAPAWSRSFFEVSLVGWCFFLLNEAVL